MVNPAKPGSTWRPDVADLLTRVQRQQLSLAEAQIVKGNRPVKREMMPLRFLAVLLILTVATSALVGALPASANLLTGECVTEMKRVTISIPFSSLGQMMAWIRWRVKRMQATTRRSQGRTDGLALHTTFARSAARAATAGSSVETTHATGAGCRRRQARAAARTTSPAARRRTAIGSTLDAAAPAQPPSAVTKERDA